MKFLFIHFETPNFRQNRLSKLAVVLTQDDQVLATECWEIDPEVPFDNGERPQTDRTFIHYWPQLKSYLQEANRLVLYHAEQSLATLTATMHAYGVTNKAIEYSGCYQQARRILVLPHYDLKTVCNHYGLKLAPGATLLEDTHAVRQLFFKLRSEPEWTHNNQKLWSFGPAVPQDNCLNFFEDLKQLEQLVSSIKCDGEVQVEEFERLKEWRDSHQAKRFEPGYAPSMAMLDKVLADGVLTIDECDELIDWLSSHRPVSSDDLDNCWRYLLQNIAPEVVLHDEERDFIISWMNKHQWLDSEIQKMQENLEGAISEALLTAEEGQAILHKFSLLTKSPADNSATKSLKGKVCVLTGSFVSGSRSQMIKRILAEGGVVASTVSAKTDLLIVGGDDLLGHSQRSGRQLDRAKMLKDQGEQLEIIGELTIWPPNQQKRWRHICSNLIMGLITLNLFTSILEVMPSIAEQFNQELSLFNTFSSVVFVIEMTVRIILDKKSFFVGRHAGWNYFDLIITLLTTLPLSGNSSIATFRIFRYFRVIRSLRTLRIFSHIKNLRSILGAMVKSLPKIGWTFLMMVVVFLIYGIVGTNLFNTIATADGVQYFGSIGKSLFTLVQLMTFDDLGNIANPIIAEEPWSFIFFLSFIFVISFVMLNIFTGIIVDSIADLSGREEEE